MTRTRAIIGAVFTLVAVALAWVLFVALPRWYGNTSPAPASTAALAAAPNSPETPVRKIKARLFYVSEDGAHLRSVERDVPYADQTVDQAKEILKEQLAPATEPLVSAVPAGTTLRALFVTPKGEAFVDLSREVAAAHPGGSMNERLTIYTFVHALTSNLPAVKAVQILVDGKEVETLAGHLDMRRPLARNAQLTIDRTTP